MGLSECEFRVAQGHHRGERGGFCLAEGSDLLIAVEHGTQVVQVDRDIFAVFGVAHEDEPFDDVAFDGLGDIVDGVGAVGESEIDDGGGAGARAGVAPEEIGGVQVVVCPERMERGQERLKFLMEGREQIERLFAIAASR